MILTSEALESLRGQLIVSCQAYPGEPMRDPRTTGQVAASAVIGGAAAVRVQGLSGSGRTAMTASSSLPPFGTPWLWLTPAPMWWQSTAPADAGRTASPWRRR